MNLEKNDHGNEFKGSKNGGREVWVGLKWPKNDKIRRPKVAATVVFASLSERARRQLAMKFHCDGSLVVALLPGLRVYSCGGRNRLPRLKPDRLENRSKRPSSRFSGFRIFSWVLGSDPHLAPKTRLI